MLPEFFGPMWPNGAPEGWPESGLEARSTESDRYIFELEFPDDATDDDIVRAITELHARLDDAQRTEGGRGVKIAAINVPQRARVTGGVL